MRRRVPVRAVAPAACCVMAMLVACSSAWATHNRATQLSWSAGAEAGEVQFSIDFVARAGYYGSPKVGETIVDPFLEFGDGEGLNPSLLITEIEDDTLYAHATVPHTYLADGPYTAIIGSCCRLSASSGHVSNGDLSYQVHTLVDLSKASSSPSVAVAPVVFCPVAGSCSFAFSGTGADPGNHLEWRLATPAETGDSSFVQPGPPFAPNAATVDPTLGRVTWNTAGATLSAEGLPTYYSIQAVAEERNGADELVSETAADFFIALGEGEAEQPDCVDTDSNGLVDNDEDGLCDNWETEGIDANHDEVSDFYLPVGADPDKPDIFVEIDYMRDREPQADALDDVVAAFARHGIKLHLLIDDEIPFNENLTFGEACGSCGPDVSDFDTIKEVYFGTAGTRSLPSWAVMRDARSFVYHYAVYGDELAEGGGSSGRAELPGNDFVITLGDFRTFRLFGSGPPTRRNEAGTFMHELGHNLALWHGGGDPRNCKPNYLSVMNYTRQMTGPITAQLDYSDAVLPTLDERDLDESLGVQGPSGAEVVVGPGAAEVWDSTGPINWDREGGFESGVEADVNYIIGDDGVICGESGGQELVGWDDWENLKLAFQATADFGDGVHSTLLAQEPEVTAEVLSSFDADGDGVPNVYDRCVNVPGPADNAGCPREEQDDDAPSARRRASASTPPPVTGVAPARPLPNTKLRRVRFRNGKRFAKFFFAAGGEAGLRFQCKLDRRKFRKCRSPVALRRLRRGRHVFRVRAIDALGRVEKRAAIRRFKTRRVVHRRARR